MAEIFTGPSSQNSQNNVQSKSKTNFLSPQLLKQLMALFGGVMGDTAGGYANFVNDPTSSPAFQNSLSGLIASLAPQEQASRNALTDQFRAAGGLRGSAYGNAAGTLEGDIIGNQQTMASNLLAQMYPQIASAMFAPMGQLSSILSGAKGQTSQTFGSNTNQGGGLARTGPINNMSPGWSMGGWF